jgi:hypothetical protein
MNRTPLPGRLLIGALAGMVGTAAMTAAMRRLHGRLPPRDRYPLPPREITETVIGTGAAAEDLSLAAHFAFGAAAGALMTSREADLPVSRGILGALAVWTASYFGWVPAAGILTPAHRHPLRRNALMIAVHVVWGAVTALTAHELVHSRDSVVADGPLLDRP